MTAAYTTTILRNIVVTARLPAGVSSAWGASAIEIFASTWEGIL